MHVRCLPGCLPGISPVQATLVVYPLELGAQLAKPLPNPARRLAHLVGDLAL
jgi:hypothetical protein